MMKQRIYFLIIALYLCAVANSVQAGVVFVTPEIPPIIPFTGGTYVIAIVGNSNPDESWDVTKDNSSTWITLSSPTSGNGLSLGGVVTVTVTVARNMATTQRSGEVVVTCSGGGDITYTITQAGRGASTSTLSLSAPQTAWPYGDFGPAFQVSSNTSWTVSSNQTWLTFPSGSSGNGTVWVNCDVSENTSPGSRTAIIRVETTDGSKEETLTITQFGTSPLFTVSPATLNFTTAAAGTQTFNITTQPELNIYWEIESNAAWATVSTNEDSNNKTITVTVTANPSTTPREMHFTLTSDESKDTPKVTVKQAGAAPATVAPTITSDDSYTCPAGTGGNLTLVASGTTPITWNVIGAPAGVTVSGSTLNVASTVAADTYTFTITASNGTLPDATQTFTLTVTSTVVSVTGVTLNKTAIPMIVGGTATLIPAIEPATATNQNVTWSSSNTGVATVSAAGLVRAISAGTAVITVTTQDSGHTDECTVTVTGGGGTSPSPSISFPITPLSYDRSGGEQTFTLTANTDWTITCPASWITVMPSSGSSGATITVKVAANTTGAPRSATLTVSGTGVTPQPVSVTQSNTTVANEAIAPPSLTAYARDGILHVSGLTVGESWRVYTILGQLVWQGAASSDKAEIPLPAKGVYIITDGKNTVKINN